MISEESCYTEDWSNDAENSALRQKNKLHFVIYDNKKNIHLNCNTISDFFFFMYWGA